MKEYETDTSENYDDMVDYVAKENLSTSLMSFFSGEEEQIHTAQIKKKKVDPEFPEEWQSIFINFNSLEEYAEFMQMIDMKPIPRQKEFVFAPNETVGLLKLFGDLDDN